MSTFLIQDSDDSDKTSSTGHRHKPITKQTSLPPNFTFNVSPPSPDPTSQRDNVSENEGLLVFEFLNFYLQYALLKMKLRSVKCRLVSSVLQESHFNFINLKVAVPPVGYSLTLVWVIVNTVHVYSYIPANISFVQNLHHVIVYSCQYTCTAAAVKAHITCTCTCSLCFLLKFLNSIF